MSGPLLISILRMSSLRDLLTSLLWYARQKGICAISTCICARSLTFFLPVKTGGNNDRYFPDILLVFFFLFSYFPLFFPIHILNRTFCRFSPVSSGTDSRWWYKNGQPLFFSPACARTGPTDATKTFSCFYPARTPCYYRAFSQPQTIDRSYVILSIHDARQIPVQHASRAAMLCRVSETSLRSLFFFLTAACAPSIPSTAPCFKLDHLSCFTSSYTFPRCNHCRA